MEKNILIVDDEEAVLRTLSRQLTLEGYQVHAANSGHQGLEILEKHHIPVIISDQRMPEMDGAEFLSKVKQRYPETVRLILSGYSDFTALSNAINRGMIFRFLQKPWQQQQLVSEIEAAFSNYQQTQQAKAKGEFDAITKLPKYEHFYQHLEAVLSTAKLSPKTLAVIILDIDRFKYINNVLGHQLGDLTLKAISQRLTQWANHSELIARLGNDEFAILFNATDDDMTLTEYLNGLQQLFNEPLPVESHQLHIMLSIGVSEFQRDNTSASQLVQQAHAALTHAKNLGINQHQFYSSSMAVDSKNRLLIENDIRKAITQNQFELYFQPKMSLESNTTTSAEGLIRWNHPKYGLVQPNDFMAVCEDTGLILEIEEATLQQGCHIIKLCQAMLGQQITISINLSAKEFSKPGLAELIQQVLRQTDTPAHLLELEITESMLMQDIEHCETILQALHRIGVKLALDDFGTGYSSLSYLANLPFDTVKIDQSFTKKILICDKMRAILCNMLSLCQQLSLTTVVEGVESEEQVRLLRDYGCDFIQGYYLSKPLTEQGFIQFLNDSSQTDIIIN